jgi:hypothetical protein
VKGIFHGSGGSQKNSGLKSPKVTALVTGGNQKKLGGEKPKTPRVSVAEKAAGCKTKKVNAKVNVD